MQHINRSGQNEPCRPPERCRHRDPKQSPPHRHRRSREEVWHPCVCLPAARRKVHNPSATSPVPASPGKHAGSTRPRLPALGRTGSAFAFFIVISLYVQADVRQNVSPPKYCGSSGAVAGVFSAHCSAAMRGSARMCRDETKACDKARSCAYATARRASK